MVWVVDMFGGYGPNLLYDIINSMAADDLEIQCINSDAIDLISPRLFPAQHQKAWDVIFLLKCHCMLNSPEANLWHLIFLHAIKDKIMSSFIQKAYIVCKNTDNACWNFWQLYFRKYWCKTIYIENKTKTRYTHQWSYNCWKRWDIWVRTIKITESSWYHRYIGKSTDYVYGIWQHKGLCMKTLFPSKIIWEEK